MDIIKKLNILIQDETVTGDVEIPDGERIGIKYKKKKRKNKLDKDIIVHETVVGGSYVDSLSNITGSGQTRIVGRRDGEIEVLKRNPRPLKWNNLLGAYLPDMFEEGEDE